MKSRAHDPRHLDVPAFAADAVQLDGRWPLAELERVQDVVPAQVRGEAMDVHWSVTGERRRPQAVEPENWLHLVARAIVWLECQRCLQPVAVPLEVRRSFRFVRGEDAAARLDAESEDEVLELTQALDLQELVEDELLLALPIVPRHEQCAQAPQMRHEAEESEPAPNPFAALEALKRGRPQ